ncbi:MAG: hypothetical protein JSR82_13530 [Verrucomicrobia bacterium]|nr:hypothetical protein [Verrucomicrobiota bacterium]
MKIKNPSGVTILTQNTGFDEDVSFTTTVAGTYMVETTAFNANAGGDYVLIVYALNELYLWHGDEIIHGGVHRWKAQNVGTKQYRTATAPLGGNVSIP